MDKKEFVIRQLARTKSKKYEQYVVTRIVHLLNDLDIKFVTQQYVKRPDGIALVDLYFPQISLLIEVDEGQHEAEAHIKADKVRDADIVNATNHKPVRISATNSIEEINREIDEIVETIKLKVKSDSTFIPWDIDAEFNSETYINLGYIDNADNVAFRTIKDACNCFGHSYKGFQRASSQHPHKSDTILWFPKLYENELWDNSISDDEKVIRERSKDDAYAPEHVRSHKANKEKHKHKRIVFARVKGNLGDVLYRFRGLYELNLDDSNKKTGLVWKRTATRVQTYPHLLQ